MFIGPALYPLEDPNEWADRYELELLEVPCMSCEHPLVMNRPWASKGLRGLTTFPCPACGETRTPFIYTIQ